MMIYKLRTSSRRISRSNLFRFLIRLTRICRVCLFEIRSTKVTSDGREGGGGHVKGGIFSLPIISSKALRVDTNICGHCSWRLLLSTLSVFFCLLALAGCRLRVETKRKSRSEKRKNYRLLVYFEVWFRRNFRG